MPYLTPEKLFIFDQLKTLPDELDQSQGLGTSRLVLKIGNGCIPMVGYFLSCNG